MIYILPYNKHSRSAKVMAEALGCTRLKTSGSRFKGNSSKTVLCWGKANITREHEKCKVINNPNTIEDCVNKINFLNLLVWNEIPTVEFFFNPDDRPEGKTILARTIINGSGGEGIIIVPPDQPLPPAPLYTVYKKKKAEYRVHFLNDTCFYVQQKKRNLGVENPNWMVRSHDNGFVFARATEVPPKVMEVATLFASQLFIDFGALDIIYNEHEDMAYILECNSAPGVEPSTAEEYRKELFKQGYVR